MALIISKTHIPDPLSLNANSISQMMITEDSMFIVPPFHTQVFLPSLFIAETELGF